MVSHIPTVSTTALTHIIPRTIVRFLLTWNGKHAAEKDPASVPLANLQARQIARAIDSVFGEKERPTDLR